MLWMILFSCQEEEKSTGPTGVGNDVFCSSYEDADTEQFTEDVELAGSGVLEVQLVVDATNYKDTSLVGNSTYTFNNIDAGGGEQLGQADFQGYISKTLGAGNWHFRFTGETGCENEMDILIEEGVRTEKCIPLYCE